MTNGSLAIYVTLSRLRIHLWGDSPLYHAGVDVLLFVRSKLHVPLLGAARTGLHTHTHTLVAMLLFVCTSLVPPVAA